MKHIPLMIVLACLLGCATTFRPWMLSEVKEGMDSAEVVSILGEPDSIEAKDGEELWYYSYSENYNPGPADMDIIASDGSGSFRDQEIKRSLQVYRYVIILADGKVQTYKELPQQSED